MILSALNWPALRLVVQPSSSTSGTINQWTVCAWRGAWPLARRSLQRPEGAGLVRIDVGVGQVRLALLFDQHPQTGKQLHRAGDDLVQHRLQRFIGWRRYRDEFRRAVCAAPVHAFQHQAGGTYSFTAQPPDLRSFALITRASRFHARSPCSAAPSIRFLSIGSQLRSTLPPQQSVALLQLRFTSLAVINSRRDLHPQECPLRSGAVVRCDQRWKRWSQLTQRSATSRVQ